nr:hypothetical protein [candidate division Zixibacteria bacterium]
MSNETGSSSGSSLENTERNTLNIPTLGYTLLGLLTGGVFWSFYFACWARKHQEIVGQKLPKTRRSTVIGVMTGSLGMVLLFFIVLSLVTGWDVTANNGPFEINEEFFWFLCWIDLALVGVTWGSVIFEVRNAMSIIGPDRVDAWLLSGGKERVVILVLINVVFALGLLPLVIFPPIAASSLNKYVNAHTA